jgi:hypothetical protein
VLGESRLPHLVQIIGFLPRVVSLQPDARGTYNDEFAVIVYLHVDLDDNETDEKGIKFLAWHVLNLQNKAESSE